jgi:hypothetical protein
MLVGMAQLITVLMLVAVVVALAVPGIQLLLGSGVPAALEH